MFGISFGWALVTGLVAGLAALLATRNGRRVFAPAACAFGIQLVLGLFTMYFIMPALVGTFFGMNSFVLQSAITLALTGLAMGFRDFNYSDGDERRPIGMGIGAGSLLFLLFLVWVGTYIGVTWSTNNARINASLASVKIASAEETLPKTDPDHMVLVTQSMAAYLGQQALASNGNNLGSIYQTVKEDFALQGVKGHLYWVAPLVYVRDWNRMGFGLDDIGVRGGFVAVDAEDPNAAVQIHQEHNLIYLPEMFWGRNLLRHVYSSGYKYGKLAQPTIEVDDNWKPYFTISYTVPKRTVRGDVVEKVLLVDPSNGNIDEYAPDKVPAWVDRFMYGSLIKEYLDVWGAWGDPKALADWPQLFTTKFQTTPDDFELLYNDADKPVFLVPMTSRNESDLSCTGVVLYDSNKHEGTFYPGLAGIGIGKNVTDAFEHSPRNLKGYKIGHLQLYSINGEPTWVGIYVQPAGSHGTTFAAIGMLDARHVQGANVVMASDKRSALAAYASYLATARQGGGGHVPKAGQPSKVVSGKVFRIGWTVVDGQTVYTFKVVGDPHTFSATLKVRPDLALVHEGDSITLSYLETGEASESVIDLAVEELDAAKAKQPEVNARPAPANSK